jgi:hypothetical protein
MALDERVARFRFWRHGTATYAVLPGATHSTPSTHYLPRNMVIDESGAIPSVPRRLPRGRRATYRDVTCSRRRSNVAGRMQICGGEGNCAARPR